MKLKLVLVAGAILFSGVLYAQTPDEETPAAEDGHDLNVEVLRPNIVWAQIPAGSFMMGCKVGNKKKKHCKKYHHRWQMPSHQVEISRSFEMAETETTNAEYRKCVEHGPCPAPMFLVGQELLEHPAKRAHPVVYVTWKDAVTFCGWVGGRLPTEAEWEYAARGGKNSWVYPWGNSYIRENANHQLTEGRDQWSGTSPVRSFPANGYGLYDMIGNVQDWVSDWFDEDYYKNSPSTDPKGPSSGKYHVIRGSGWTSWIDNSEVSDRSGVEGSWSVKWTGFRCVRDVIP